MSPFLAKEGDEDEDEDQGEGEEEGGGEEEEVPTRTAPTSSAPILASQHGKKMK